ncbi:hypothetical protein BDR03DRAFT_962622 [Suillus americanus]|nr:hypothetical protein BDR03DRAFT_962622 [Suillus americanus]
MKRHLNLKKIFPITSLLRNPLEFRPRKLLDGLKVAREADWRFKVEPKLGFGTTSNLWLSCDLRYIVGHFNAYLVTGCCILLMLRKDNYVAPKISNEYASKLGRQTSGTQSAAAPVV